MYRLFCSIVFVLLSSNLVAEPQNATNNADKAPLWKSQTWYLHEVHENSQEALRQAKYYWDIEKIANVEVFQMFESTPNHAVAFGPFPNDKAAEKFFKITKKNNHLFDLKFKDGRLREGSRWHAQIDTYKVSEPASKFNQSIASIVVKVTNTSIDTKNCVFNLEFTNTDTQDSFIVRMTTAGSSGTTFTAQKDNIQNSINVAELSTEDGKWENLEVKVRRSTYPSTTCEPTGQTTYSITKHYDKNSFRVYSDGGIELLTLWLDPTEVNQLPKTDNTSESPVKNEYDDQELLDVGKLTKSEKEDIQRALQSHDLYDGGIDGDFGPQTETAIKDYQYEKLEETTGQLTQNQYHRLLDLFSVMEE